jgi:FKBP-type peptidyl-prolyl cis-trans isomerase
MRRLVPVLLAVILIAAACGGDSDSETGTGDTAGTSETSTSSVQTTAVADTPPAEIGSAAGSVSASDEAGKPNLTIDDNTAPVGLLISDTITGEGAEAGVGSLVELHYVGVLLDDGTEFDNSWDRGATFFVTVGAGGVIPGFDQGLMGMAEGGRRVVVIPSNLGYGSAGAGGVIPPDAAIVFAIDMVSVFSGEKPEAPEVDAPPTDLEITDVTIGEGDPVEAGDTITVHYHGTLLDGTVFDSSWDRGQPFTTAIGVGQVIAGWDEGMVGMRVGGRRILVIPSDLAYGESGSGGVIGPNAPLAFVVDLLAIVG